MKLAGIERPKVRRFARDKEMTEREKAAIKLSVRPYQRKIDGAKKNMREELPTASQL